MISHVGDIYMGDCPINKRLRQKVRVFSTVEGDLYTGDSQEEAKKMFDDLKRKHDERKSDGKDGKSGEDEDQVLLMIDGKIEELFII